MNRIHQKFLSRGASGKFHCFIEGTSRSLCGRRSQTGPVPSLSGTIGSEPVGLAPMSCVKCFNAVQELRAQGLLRTR